MSRPNDTQNWRTRVGWLVGQLFVIFLGVSAAFVVENYRETLSQREELHQAVAGIITEMEHYEKRSVQFADAFNAATERWAAADREGRRAVPGYYRIPGGTHPPTAAWNTAVTSGIARMLEPKLRMELGYFYSEFVGIHDNYDRYNQFTEREVLPRSDWWAGRFLRTGWQTAPDFSRTHGPAKRIRRRPAQAGPDGTRASRAPPSSACFQVISWLPSAILNASPTKL